MAGCYCLVYQYSIYLKYSGFIFANCFLGISCKDSLRATNGLSMYILISSAMPLNTLVRFGMRFCDYNLQHKYCQSRIQHSVQPVVQRYAPCVVLYSQNISTAKQAMPPHNGIAKIPAMEYNLDNAPRALCLRLNVIEYESAQARV